MSTEPHEMAARRSAPDGSVASGASEGPAAPLATEVKHRYMAVWSATAERAPVNQKSGRGRASARAVARSARKASAGATVTKIPTSSALVSRMGVQEKRL